MRMVIRVRYVAQADFRRSELTNFYDPAVVPVDLRNRLRAGDAVCLHSGGGDQVVFVFKPATVTRVDGEEVEVVPSAKLRLPRNRRWDPLMIATYARDAGLEAAGLRKLEERLKPFGGNHEAE